MGIFFCGKNMKRFVIAVLHFGHENIIKYEKRPFKNATEMFYLPKEEALRDEMNKQRELLESEARK